MNKVYIIPFLISSILIISCTNSSLRKKKAQAVQKSYIKNFETITLDYQLKEISGITFINDSLIAAVEDENGIVYFLDLSQKKIVRKLIFEDSGDFEDITKVKTDLFIINSKGNLTQIVSFEDKKPQVIQHKTVFKKKNDIESVVYDEAQHQLLIAVKEEDLKGNEDKKAVYTCSLNNFKVDKEPYLSISHQKLLAIFEGDRWEELSKAFLKKLGNENLNKVFSPTAMAIHPKDKDLYILSSTNNFIVVAHEKEIKQVISLVGNAFTQPEGMAFNSKGELYISNEGKKLSGNILKITSIYDK
jgi:WD40 repeat protein